MKKNIDLIFGIIFIIYFAILRTVRLKGFAFDKEMFISGLLLVVYHFFKVKIDYFNYGHIIRKSISSAAIIFISVFLIIEAVIVLYPKYNEEKCDYVLVLGAGIEGRNPSLVLKNRLDKAVEVLKAQDDYVVVSGGQGYDEETAEAHVMKDYLMKKGIPENKIIEEDKSTNTLENFKFSKEKIENHSNKKIEQSKVKIITTDFHALRSSILAERSGYKNITNDSSSGVWYITPLMYAREAFALVKSYIFDR